MATLADEDSNYDTDFLNVCPLMCYGRRKSHVLHFLCGIDTCQAVTKWNVAATIPVYFLYFLRIPFVLFCDTSYQGCTLSSHRTTVQRPLS